MNHNEQELRAAYARLQSQHPGIEWPDCYEAAMARPLRAGQIHLEVARLRMLAVKAPLVIARQFAGPHRVAQPLPAAQDRKRAASGDRDE